MLHPPLNSEGVKMKLTELYALNKAEFNIAIFLVDVNFLKWLKSSFTLTEDQLLFLQGVEEETWRFFGEQCSICLHERFEITLISQTRSNNSYNKYVDLIINRKVRTNGLEMKNVSGSLAFVVNYQK